MIAPFFIAFVNHFSLVCQRNRYSVTLWLVYKKPCFTGVTMDIIPINLFLLSTNSV